MFQWSPFLCVLTTQDSAWHIAGASVNTYGDKDLLPEYGGTKVLPDDKDYFLFRDGDILAGHSGSSL